jgi:hypothetical protein
MSLHLSENYELIVGTKLEDIHLRCILWIC